MSAQAPSASDPTRRQRPDGSIEYRCPECGKLLYVAKFERGWVQGFCSRCKRERRFSEG